MSSTANNKVLEATLIAFARSAIRDDCQLFVREFVHIEDLDTGTPIRFTLWPKQADALKAFHDNRLVVVLKARQLGLTWLALAYAVWCLITKPGFRVVGLSRGENEARELVRRAKFILRHLPAWLCVQGSAASDGRVAWDGSTEQIRFTHPSGEDGAFISFAASQDSGRAFTASLVVIDEWAFQQWAKDIWTAAYPTINRPGGGKVIGLSTGKRGTFFEEVWRKARGGMNTFVAVFLNWRSDPRRTVEWREASKRDLPHSWKQEYPENEEDAFSAGEGAAFPEFSDEIHACFDRLWYPPRDWKIVRAYDSGYVTRACCKWYAISPDGWAVCYREYYPQMVVDSDQAAEIRRLSVTPDGEAEVIARTVGDPACWQKKSNMGLSTAEIFAKNGITMEPANNDRIQGWRVLREWLKVFEGEDGEPMTLLRFTKSCVNTIRTYPSLEVDKNRPEDIDTDGEDHPADCDRYFCMSRPKPYDEAQKPLDPNGVYTLAELRGKHGMSDSQIRRLKGIHILDNKRR